MALKAGRVGVAPSQVDMAGNIIGGGSESYTKAESDAKYATKTQLTANEKEFNFAYDATTQKYGYKAGATGEFHPFEEGGSGGIGWVTPPELITTGLIFNYFTYVKGGYQVVDDIVYVDLTVLVNSKANLQGFPTCADSSGRFLVVKGDTAADVQDNNIGNTDGVYMFAGSGNLNLQNVSSTNKYYHIFGAYIKE